MLGGNLEIIVDFLSFRNIDLYEQGYYAIRVQLSSENSEIVQPYLVLSPNNGEGIQDSSFCTRTFDISYSDQYIELDNSCLFRIFYKAYPNKNPKITIKCELLYSITQEQLTPVSSFECNIQSGCDGQQQGIDVLFDQQHFCTARLYIYTIVLGYRYTGADFQDFIQENSTIYLYLDHLINNLIMDYVDSLYSVQMKYKNLLIQIINLQKDKNMQIQQLMKIPVVQTAKFKTTIQLKSFGQDFLQIVNQLGQTLFQLWYHFQTLLKGCRSYLLEAVDPRILQNCRKQAAEHILSCQVSFAELEQQLPKLKQREEIYQQARKTQIQYTVVLQDNNYAMGNPFIFEDIFTDGQLNRSQKKHVIVLAHGYQGTSMDMQIWKNFLRIKFPNHLIIQSQINEDDTEDSILSMSYKLSQEISNLISERVPQKCQISLSFIGHSLGGVLIRAALPHLQKYQDCMHTYISLASPHVGLGVQQSSLIDAGLWMMKAFSKEKKICLNQMTLSDEKDLQKTCMYRISQNSRLCWFKNAIFAFSPQDQYVPFSAASLSKVEPSNARENLHNQMVDSILESPPQTIIKSTVFFPNMKNALDKMIGRAAHIEFIDNPNFIRIFIDYYYEYLQ